MSEIAERPKSLQNKRDICLSALRDLAASRTVTGLVVGITKDVAERRRAYLNQGFVGLFIIYDHMTCKEALDLEEAVHMR